MSTPVRCSTAKVAAPAQPDSGLAALVPGVRHCMEILGELMVATGMRDLGRRGAEVVGKVRLRSVVEEKLRKALCAPACGDRKSSVSSD